MATIYGKFTTKKEAAEMLDRVTSAVWDSREDNNVSVMKMNDKDGYKWGFSVYTFLEPSDVIFQQSLFQLPGIKVKPD
ncbi:hypothetical protein ACQVQT_16215 [Bacillus paranthracis]|nr:MULTISPECIES: hypothetical protein [Bacillus cereus group]KXI38011.1 hypothetical protein ACS53_19630 [Bacillus cereus]MCC2457968.1 hypothetical protein [Bacillus cereus]MCC2479778.1 hypothetical protein [Bacillus paranthracis]MCU5017640.1 hypothetical protein [Bacillus paranthracis]MCU5202363.1 hypothetical protein [Bacillus paranthracis]